MNDLSRRDQLGTTVAAYEDKFSAALPPGAQPTQGTLPPAQLSVTSGPSPQMRDWILRAAQNPRTRTMAFQQLGQLNPQPQWDKLNDETLFDKRTAQIRSIPGSYRPLTDPAERARYGIPAEDNRPYQVGPGGKLINPPPETRVNIDQRGEGAFTTKASEIQAKRFGEIAEGGTNARQMLSDLETLRTLSAQINTGKGAQVMAMLGPYAQALGVNVTGLNEMQAFEAITSRLAPNLRVPGTGAQSDFELRSFLKSMPSLGNLPGGNELITSTLQGLFQNRLRAAQIASMALNRQISPADADKMISELPDPMAGYREFIKRSNPAAAQKMNDLRKRYRLE
jgi:hypothetical protein